VAHHIINRWRVLRRAAEEDEGVLHHLLELRVVEELRNVVVHRAEQLEADGCGAHHVEVDPVTVTGPVGVDEAVHRSAVVCGAFLDILVEGLGRTRLARLEGCTYLIQVGGDVHPVAVLPEDPVVWVEALEVVVVRGRLVEVAEETLEDVGHQVPGGTHVELETLGFEGARPAADRLVLLQYLDIGPGVGEVTRRR
jgi:hypothetical protein